MRLFCMIHAKKLQKGFAEKHVQLSTINGPWQKFGGIQAQNQNYEKKSKHQRLPNVLGAFLQLSICEAPPT